MRYHCVILEGYRRMRMSVNRLEWRPTTAYQIILGTNGSGKSSLLAELSPLPLNPADFDKGGSKYIELEHKGHHYELLNVKGSSSVKHSFKYDGEELNTGGTGPVQLELIAQHLKYYKELHPVLTGRKGYNFTEMSQATRRYWVTKLSSADHTYGLTVFDRLNRAHNDMTGHLKVAKRRLTEEQHSLSQMGVGDDVEERVRALQNELSALLLARLPQALPVDQAEGALRQGVRALEAAGTAIEQTVQEMDLRFVHRGTEELRQALQAMQEVETVHRTRLERYQHEYADVEALVHSFAAVEVVDEEAAKARLAHLVDAEAIERHAILFFPQLMDATDPVSIQRATGEVLSGVMQTFAELPDNSDRRFNREAIKQAQERKFVEQNRIDNATSGLRIVNQRIHTIDHAQPETCPQCTFRFVPGLNPHEREEMVAKAEAFKRERETSEAVLAETLKYLEAAEEYMALYRRWRGYVNQYPSMQELWSFLQTNGYDIENPGDHRDVFLRWQQEVDAAVRLREIVDERQKLEKLLASSGAGGPAALAARLRAIESAMVSETDRLKHAQERRHAIQLQLRLFQNLDSQIDRWNEIMGGLETRYEAAIEAVASHQVEQDITRTQGQLGALQHTLHAKQVLQAVVAEQTKMIEEAELDAAALGLLVKELSPKEGFIAEQIRGFIECFTGQLNAVISEVWSYDLEVLPCANDGGSLDYKFPMRCDVEGPTPSDVSEGSTSQRDMVDFAFRQTLMLYSGLEDFPLYVDELGASFDEAHRPAINQFIARLMDSHLYSQVFMISHYVAGYSAFADAEYLVLDSRNIAVPEPHNTHAKLS